MKIQLLATSVLVLLLCSIVASLTHGQTTTTASPAATPTTTSPLNTIAAPETVSPAKIPVGDLDEDHGIASLEVQLRFAPTQFQQWLSSASVILAGRAPRYDQPFGLEATFAGALPSDKVQLVNALSLNVTLTSSKCLSMVDTDDLIFRFDSNTLAVRVMDPATLETRDVTGDKVPEIKTTVTVAGVDDTRTAGLGVVAFSFALICLLFLLSDWTQATVSCMQLQWIVMLSMQTCTPLSTSAIVQNSHWILWPLSGRLQPSFPEYAFRMLFNMLVLLFVLGLELLMIGAFIFVGKDRVTAMQRVRFPSTLGVALALLLPSGCMFAATQVFALLNNGASAAGGPQVTYAVVSLLLSIAYLVLVCLATFTVVSRLVYRDLQPRANRSWFQRLTNPDGEWLVEAAVSARWGLLFDGYSVRGFWVFAAQQIITFLFAVASGPAPESQTGCSAKGYVNVVTAVILAALHVVRKPYNSAMANLTNTVVALAIVVQCVAIVSAGSCSGKSRVFASACTWGALLVLLIKVLAHCMLTAFSSVNQFLFAAEQQRAADAAAGGVLGDENDELGGRLIVPYAHGAGGDLNDKTIPLDAGDAFELRLFSGADNMGDASLASATAGVGAVALGSSSNNGTPTTSSGRAALPGVAGDAAANTTPKAIETSASTGDFGSSPSPGHHHHHQRSVALSPVRSSNGGGGGIGDIAGLRPVLGNPVMIAGAFLKREVGFGRMGGLRGSTGPSLVIQLHAPVCCAVSSSGVVLIVEAGFRGAALGQRGGGGGVNNNSSSVRTPGSSSSIVPKDAKPRLLAHAPESRRVEELVLRDASVLRDALLASSGGASRRRAGSSIGGGGGKDSTSDGGNSSTTNNNNNSPSNNTREATAANSSSSSGGTILKLPTACCTGQACIFICDADEGSVVRVDLLSGLVSTVISDLLKPSGVAVFGDVLYVSDTLRHRVLGVDLLAGQVTVVCGTGAAGFDADGTPAGASRLNCPQGLCVCAESAELYIADSCNHRVVCVPLSVKTARTVIGVAGVVATDDAMMMMTAINNSMAMMKGRETPLAMPTQVVARVAKEAQALDASAFAVEVFVIEAGHSRIWHVSRFGYAHVVLPANEYIIPHAMCLAPVGGGAVPTSLYVSPSRYGENSESRNNSTIAELLVVDTQQQILARVSMPSLQPAIAQHRERIPEFQFALPKRSVNAVNISVSAPPQNSNINNSTRNGTAGASPVSLSAAMDVVTPIVVNNGTNDDGL